MFVDDIDDIPEGAVTVFSAHGVSPQVRDQAAARELKIIDATCPLVTKVHAEARRFAKAGYRIVLVGHEGHEEVEGTTGEAPEAIQTIGTVDEIGDDRGRRRRPGRVPDADDAGRGRGRGRRRCAARPVPRP